MKIIRIIGQILFGFIVIGLLYWILCVDFPTIGNCDNWFEGLAHLTYAMLRSLLLIWATIVLLVLKK